MLYGHTLLRAFISRVYMYVVTCVSSFLQVRTFASTCVVSYVREWGSARVYLSIHLSFID